MVMDREERRKRIMERGTDRLALITGQLHNLDPSSPSSSSSSSASHNRTYSESFMPQTRPTHHMIQESPSLKYQFKEEVKAREEPTLSTTLHKPIKSESTKPEEARPIKSQSQSQRPKSFFGSKKLNASIISSERTRNLSSFAIAALVVLLPRLNIMRPDSILAFRPLWLLLLTDCAIVVSHLTLEASIHEMEDEGKGSKDGNNGQNWSDAEKLLERGLVVYQALRGMFIDCSIYMVIVVCGVCLF